MTVSRSTPKSEQTSRSNINHRMVSSEDSQEPLLTFSPPPRIPRMHATKKGGLVVYYGRKPVSNSTIDDLAHRTSQFRLGPTGMVSKSGDTTQSQENEISRPYSESCSSVTDDSLPAAQSSSSSSLACSMKRIPSAADLSVEISPRTVPSTRPARRGVKRASLDTDASETMDHDGDSICHDLDGKGEEEENEDMTRFRTPLRGRECKNRRLLSPPSTRPSWPGFATPAKPCRGDAEGVGATLMSPRPQSQTRRGNKDGEHAIGMSPWFVRSLWNPPPEQDALLVVR
eukprot:TRINITY_DN12011_c0_g1_i2.p1 TRINITY_DN12011_c0_g1~~TRINITY_DN12011_c0_g1_i2.p1  ORF type:complete len:286 (+),score=13.92 TRINITY_DN12011_c0_g1_i2:137-994(+)